jgi:hypothetical protein
MPSAHRHSFLSKKAHLDAQQVEEKVTETLDLRPYPGVDPLPEGFANAWWWLGILAVAGLVIGWMLIRRRRAQLITPAEQLEQALQASSDVNVDPTKRYVLLYHAFRSYLAWSRHARWKALTGPEWDTALLEIAPSEFGADRIRELQEASRRGDYIRYGQGEVSEEQLKHFVCLVQEFKTQLTPNAQNAREKRSF